MQSRLSHFMRNHVRSISNKNRINFFRQMAILTRAGVGLLDALKMLHRSSKGPMKTMIGDTITLIEQGNDFSKISEYYVKFFDKTMSSMIRAGEQTGSLPETMQQLYENLKRSSEFSRKVKGAMTMPVITFVIAIGVLFFMALYVIPNFSGFLSAMGTDMPPLTQAVVDFSDYVINNWKNLLTYTIGGIVGFIALYSMVRPFKYMMHHVFIKTPLMGPIILYTSLSNFSNSMGKLVGTGIGVIDSIRVASEAGKLLPLNRVTERCIQIVTSGGDISTSFSQSNIVPSIYTDLLRAGELSGTLDHTFDQLAIIYREEADHKIATLQVMIQPIMTILIGGIVGVIAASLIMGMVALWAKQGG